MEKGTGVQHAATLFFALSLPMWVPVVPGPKIKALIVNFSDIQYPAILLKQRIYGSDVRKYSHGACGWL